MRKIILLLALISSSHAVPPDLKVWRSQKESMYTRSPQAISTYQLKQWMDEKRPLIILDARTKENDDGLRLPGAYWLPHNSPEPQLLNAVPAKDSIIIIYCENANCPASQSLATRFYRLGYSNVYRYREGLRAWVVEGYPVYHSK